MTLSTSALLKLITEFTESLSVSLLLTVSYRHGSVIFVRYFRIRLSNKMNFLILADTEIGNPETDIYLAEK